MLSFDERQNFPFFGASDETQAIFRTYSAICTPGFFVGFDALLPRPPRPQFRSEIDVLQENPVPGESGAAFCLAGIDA